MRIAYAKTDHAKKVFRGSRNFDGQDITPGKIFIDDDTTNGEERLAMIQSVIPGATVVVPAMSDLGVGAGQVKAVNAIAEAGGAVEVIVDKSTGEPVKRGRRQTVAFTEEQLESALLWWSTLSESDALAKIKDQFGLEPNRNRMNYLQRKAAVELDNFQADCEREQYEEEQRELERREMDDHFNKHPHG